MFTIQQVRLTPSVQHSTLHPTITEQDVFSEKTAILLCNLTEEENVFVDENVVKPGEGEKGEKREDR